MLILIHSLNALRYGFLLSAGALIWILLLGPGGASDKVPSSTSTLDDLWGSPPLRYLAFACWLGWTIEAAARAPTPRLQRALWFGSLALMLTGAGWYAHGFGATEPQGNAIRGWQLSELPGMLIVGALAVLPALLLRLVLDRLKAPRDN